MTTFVCAVLMVLVLFDQVRISELRMRLRSLEEERVPWLERNMISIGEALGKHGFAIQQLEERPACRKACEGKLA